VIFKIVQFSLRLVSDVLKHISMAHMPLTLPQQVSLHTDFISYKGAGARQAYNITVVELFL